MALRNNTWKLNQWYDQDVAGNVDYSGAIQLWTWGYNNEGQLGQNSVIHRSSPVQVGGGTGYFFSKGLEIGDVSVGNYTAGSIKSDGTLWVWGYNNKGELGLNAPNTAYKSSPTQVGSSTDWNFVNMGYGFSSAIKTDGTLWMWGGQGANPNGTLGQNEGTAKYSSPVQVPGTTWRNISTGIVNVFATKTDGTLWVWGGQNDAGCLGLNQGGNYSQHMRSSPTEIFGGGTTWNQAATNSYFSAATKTDGTLWTWGINTYGSLGHNSRTNRSSPTQIPGTNWSIVDQGDNSSGFALKTDGTLWSWGRNYNGQLGQNNLTNYSSPTQIPGTTWSKLAGGTTSMIALKTDGTLWGWGSNDYGSLGDNNHVQRSSPVQVLGTDWSGIIGGSKASKFSIGIKEV